MNINIAFDCISTLLTTDRPEAAAGVASTQAPAATADGTLVRPIKVEDSDSEGDNMSGAVQRHFNRIADGLARPSSNQLPPSSFQ